MQPLPQQIEAYEKLNTLKVGALFMEAGTGKTFSAYNLVQATKDKNFVLALTPCNNKANFASEIAKYGGFDVPFAVVGIESISQSDRIYLETIELLKGKKAFIIVDESLKIKNLEAKRTKRIIELGKLAEYRLILNGTPVTRNLLDIWAQMQFLSPKILKMSISQFKNTFCEWVKITKHFGSRRAIVKEFIVKYHNIDYLLSLIKPYIYECDLKLLISQNHYDWHYEIEDEIVEKYNFLKKEYLDNEKMMLKNNNIFLELTTKMQHLYCCAEEKFFLLKKLSEIHRTNKIIVFCKFVASAEEVKRRFPQFTVLTYGKHSFGLNLQDHNILVKFDKTWDYAQDEQSMRRIFRLGQEKDCLFYDFTGNVNLEKLINQNIDKKQDMSEYFKQKGREAVKEL